MVCEFVDIDAAVSQNASFAVDVANS